MNITDKTILITGASDGIGRAIAIAASKNNVNLILLGRDEAKLHDVQNMCESLGSKATVYAFDITDNAALDTAVQSIKADGVVDIIINNAGIWHKSTSVGELAPEMIQNVITTNLTAQILLTRHFIDHMKDRETAIINIISSAGMEGRAGRAAYAASKFGMRGFTEVLREETKENPIRIGAVFQGGINTNMFAKADEDMPTQKYSEPDDLADVVIYMLTRPPKLWLSEVRVTY
jgi:short-subunit dehydrogenase